MANANDEEKATAELSSQAAVSDDLEAVIPKGALDPVYEAKARVLNRAVGPLHRTI